MAAAVPRNVGYNGTTGAFLGVFAADGLTSPNGLAFGPDGNLYVVDELTNRVLRFDGTTGAPLGVFVSGGLNDPITLIFTPGPVVVPEPGSLALAGLGVLVLLGRVWRRKKAA
jgi:hypothetical protein